MKRKLLILLLWAGSAAAGAAQDMKKIRVACVGNSITAGAGLKDPAHMAYPGRLQAMMGEGYEVLNFGVSGATLLHKGNQPYWQSKAYRNALDSKPDVVFIKLGTNDSKGINRPMLDQLGADADELVRAFKVLPTHPRVVLLLPIAVFRKDTAGIYDPVIVQRIIPQLEEAAYRDSVEVVDLHSLFMDKAAMLHDGVHPDTAGAYAIAARLALVLRQDTGDPFDIWHHLDQALSPQMSSFHGYTCASFTFAGHSCKIVQPKHAAEGHPWVWRARFWGHEPQADIDLLQRGFHVVYCDVAELYGNGESIRVWNDFYALVHGAGLSAKAAMEGMSRGGVYVYNWAVENPGKVACVYVDNPVLDLKSWPGGKGKSPGSKSDWEKVRMDFNLRTPEDEAAFAQSPIDKVAEIVKGHYPMLHLLGDADELVPPAENTIPFERQVKALGGDITVYHKPGFGHHPHSLPDPAVIVDFITRYAGGRTHRVTTSWIPAR